MEHWRGTGGDKLDNCRASKFLIGTDVATSCSLSTPIGVENFRIKFEIELIAQVQNSCREMQKLQEKIETKNANAKHCDRL